MRKRRNFYFFSSLSLSLSFNYIRIKRHFRNPLDRSFLERLSIDTFKAPFIFLSLSYVFFFSSLVPPCIFALLLCLPVFFFFLLFFLFFAIFLFCCCPFFSFPAPSHLIFFVSKAIECEKTHFLRNNSY